MWESFHARRRSSPHSFAIASSLATLALATTARAQQCGVDVVLQELDANTTEPVLRTPKGAAVIGGSFALRIERGTPSIAGVLVYGAFDNPTLHPPTGAIVWPQPPWTTKFFLTNALGKSPLLLNTPDVFEDLCGEQATFQAFLFDNSAPGGLAITNAVRLRVGSVSEPLFFQGTTPVSDSGKPLEILFRDMDGDALGDLVTLETEGADALVVRPGQLAGGFGAPLSTTLTGVAPSSLDLAFLDGDSVLDAVVANKGPAGQTNTDVSVLLGDGAGGFTGEVRYFSGKGSIATALADLDEDGFLDIAVANSKEARFAVLFGDGNGAFGAPLFVAAGSGPGGSGVWDVEVADFDEDGNVDLIAPLMFGDSVSVVRGDGAGGFTAPSVMATQNEPISVELGDLNADGHVDFALSFDDAKPIAARFGNGNGTFGSELHPDSAVLLAPRTAIADMNDDDVDDLVYATLNIECVVVASNGDGTFAPHRSFLKEKGVVCMSLADVDGNGSSDLLIGDSGVRILLGDDDGTLQSPPVYDAEVASSVEAQNPVAIADVDEDGDADLVATTRDDVFKVFLGNGDGTFGAAVAYPSVHIGRGIIVEDFDLDGNLDVFTWGVTAGADGLVVVHLGNGDGTFGTTHELSGMKDHHVFIEDVNGDQVPDVLGAWLDELEVYLGNGDGSFGSPSSVRAPPGDDPFDAMAVGHFDLDADVDIACGGGDVFILLNQGDGTFAAAVLGSSFAAEELSAGDLDHDGVDDLGVRNAVTTSFGELYTLLNNGDGTFGAPVSVPANLALIDHFSFLDMDEDGRLDAFIEGLSLRVFGGAGDGSFSASTEYLALEEFWLAYVVGDVDHDGIADIVLTTNVGSIAVVRNRLGE